MLQPLGILGAVLPALWGLPVRARGPDETVGHRLVDCLRPDVSSLVSPEDANFKDARQLINQRPDVTARPLAIVRAKTSDEVQAAVACAASAGVRACARAGGHGFDNDAGCTGGLMVDVRGLQSFFLDGATNQTTFGAGHTLGQLYHKLDRHGLLVPGGAVSGVGAAGLILGCGRGLTTQLHGLACDTLREVEYVDALGRLRTADALTDPDMLWMARGGGGNFPGIVTKFTMQAFARPREVYSLHCTWNPQDAKEATRAWLARGGELVDPARKIFTSLQMWSHPAYVEVFMVCFDCNSAERRWMSSTMASVKSGTRAGWCDAPKARTWLDQILYESGYYHGQFTVPAGRPKEDGLLDPANGWGTRGMYRAAKNGGHMGNDWVVPDALLEDVLALTHRSRPHQPYGVMIEWYLTGGPKVRELAHDATAYGHRDANWVLHYKHQWGASDASMMREMMGHHLEMSRAIDLHLPCRNFYNYLDNEMPCATTNDAWLRAHFSDVPRMQAIKGSADPSGVFRSRLGGERFRVVPEGSCGDAGLRPVLDLEACAEAGAGLHLLDGTVRMTGAAGRPEGCYLFTNADGRYLWLGSNPANRGRGADTSEPGVAREPVCAVTSAGSPPRPAEPHFQRLARGSCKGAGLHPILRRATCEAAARALQLLDAAADETFEAGRPEGCYLFRDTWLFLSLSPACTGNGAETSTPEAPREPICSTRPDDARELAPAAAVAATPAAAAAARGVGASGPGAPLSRRRRRRSAGGLPVVAVHDAP